MAKTKVQRAITTGALDKHKDCSTLVPENTDVIYISSEDEGIILEGKETDKGLKKRDLKYG